MKTNDSVMREFDELGVPTGDTEPDGQGGHTASYERLVNTLTKEQESVIKSFLSHSLAEARREWVEEMRGKVGAIKVVEYSAYGDLVDKNKVLDLLTGDNPERKV